jgi:hypothetical protein
MARLFAALLLMLALTVGAQAEDAFVAVAPGVEAIPGPLGTVAEGQNALQVRLSGDAMLSSSRPLRVWLDGAEITQTVLRKESVLSCPLPASLAPGMHRISLALPGLSGSPREITWQFRKGGPVTAAAGSSDVMVTHASEKILYEGDLLDVTVRGPGGATRATASTGERISFPLTEVEPGVYKGTYEIQRGDYIMSKRVRADLSWQNGKTLTGYADKPVKLFGQFFTVRILEPKPDEEVPFNFVIKGRTRPNSRINLSPHLGAPSPNQSVLGTAPPSPGDITSGLGSIEVFSDERGFFEQKFGFPIQLFDMRYSFSVTVVGPDGEQGIPSSFTVKLNKKKDDAPPQK